MTSNLSVTVLGQVVLISGLLIFISFRFSPVCSYLLLAKALFPEGIGQSWPCKFSDVPTVPCLRMATSSLSESSLFCFFLLPTGRIKGQASTLTVCTRGLLHIMFHRIPLFHPVKSRRICQCLGLWNSVLQATLYLSFLTTTSVPVTGVHSLC